MDRKQSKKGRKRKSNVEKNKSQSYLKTIRGKITLSFGMLSFVLLVSAVISYTNMTHLDKEINYLIENDLEINRSSQDLSEILLRMESSQRGFVITGLTDLIYPFENGKYEFTEEYDILQELFKDNNKQLEKLAIIKENYESWLEYADSLVNTRKLEGLEAAASIVEAGEGTAFMEAIQTQVELIISEQKEIQANRIDALNQQVSIFKVVTISLTLFAIVLAILFSISISRGIRKNVTKISESIVEIANAGGDLTKRIEINTQDELGGLANDTNKLIDSIAGLVRQVSLMAQNVTATSQELLASAEETSTTINTIAATSSEIAAGSDATKSKMNLSSEKMSSLEEAAHFLNNQAEIVKANSTEMLLVAQKGGETVQASSEKIMSLEEIMSNTSQTVEALGKKSNEITSIIGTITDIAQQTNLLALNAAIEAARAGEHGKGFAVVADEVRKLAEQSQQAAHSVKDIILSIQQEVKNIVQQNQQGVIEVISGVEMTNQTNSSLEDIINQTKRTTVVVNEMVEHIQETLKLSKEVAKSFDQVIKITNETASNTESTAAASEEGSAAMEQITNSVSQLSNQAEELRNIVDNFKL
ncbi:methyl-accepting chemotaxis protein [Metabacillus niabensis]|uniref:Methyl-accepting chemotaxis protein n=1 Tax=Metabacillus niabensis TaxID=324854 RepID=A0ABT9Z6Z7_9BACI|nr:methyl-accepting chemotaxis protein [Metabacillus niabensis]MDQ0228031.1 methyl-accepting chemotaxis protein [Metabacillus niabensis]